MKNSQTGDLDETFAPGRDRKDSVRFVLGLTGVVDTGSRESSASNRILERFLAALGTKIQNQSVSNLLEKAS